MRRSVLFFSLLDQVFFMDKTLCLSLRKGDFAAIALVILLAVAVFAAYLPGKSMPENAVAQIFMDGKLIRELPLNEDAEYDAVGTYRNSIIVKDGKICIADSNCPGGDCMRMGWISEAGRGIVCLPNRVEIRISGASDVDFVVG